MKSIIVFETKAKESCLDFGLRYLEKIVSEMNISLVRYPLPLEESDYRQISGEKLYIGTRGDPFIDWLENEELLIYPNKKPGKEGFTLQTCPSRLMTIVGADTQGLLYGLLQLGHICKEEGQWPIQISYQDEPFFKLRGPAIGLQKTRIEPPRLTYEYPITPERFPWFYDKKSWTDFLDRLLEERCNVIYLWSGHPFSSLVRLKDYPEALEVDDMTFYKNQQMFAWLTESCEERGIWLVMKFYNIHIPYPFSRKHHLELLQSSIHPIVADYTFKSIAAFVEKYPNVGLMISLGEALRGNRNKTRWFVETILPAIKEGAKRAHLKKNPPVILRGHDCDPCEAMNQGLKVYKELSTMWKYNGESLTTYYPRGKWKKLHQELSGLGQNHIMNVHILANLEPFRFNAPSYIQKCVQAGAFHYGCRGLHLYPLFYWEWPYSPDKSLERIEQVDRDWIWYRAWFRYAWNPYRDSRDEDKYWTGQLMDHDGLSKKHASLLLKSMESIAECSPRILGRIGITEGNRQTFSLGMTMSQLTNVKRYHPNQELWDSVATRGETLEEFARKESTGEKHVGETPMDMALDVEALAEDALRKVEVIIKECELPLLSIRKKIWSHPESQDFKREIKALNGLDSNDLYRNYMDIAALYLLTHVYTYKIRAALHILDYKMTMAQGLKASLSKLEAALEPWQESQSYYEVLTQLTSISYLYANSMQTRQRKIPFEDGYKYRHWSDCMDAYEKELQHYTSNLKRMRQGDFPDMNLPEKDLSYCDSLPEVAYDLMSEKAEVYTLEEGQKVFSDQGTKIKSLIPQLKGLKAIRIPRNIAVQEGYALKLNLHGPCKILIGYFKSQGVEWLQVPKLETNTHADDRGGLRLIYGAAIQVENCPDIDIHCFDYDKGEYELYLGTGAFMVAGVVDGKEDIEPYEATWQTKIDESMDWLYEEVNVWKKPKNVSHVR